MGGDDVTYPTGTPCWTDRLTDDPDAVVPFYTGLFGWEVGPRLGPPTPFLLDGAAVANLAPVPPFADQLGGLPLWSTYLASDDLDARVGRVEPAGGRVILAPVAAGDTGRLAIVADPTGGVVTLWEPGTMRGADVTGVPGSMVFNELATRDPAAAGAFLHTVVGLEVAPPADGSPFWALSVAGRRVAGMVAMDEHWPEFLPSHWMTSFGVADCDAAASRVVELGGSVSIPPTDIPRGRFAVVGDPQGGTCSLLAPA